jgi:WD40 repeat protein
MDEQLLHGHNGFVYCVALRSNGHVASGSKSGSIIIHSTSSNKVEYRADNVFACGVCYLLDGSLVACGYDEDEGPHLKVLSPSLELVQTLVGHVGPVNCVTVSPSGSHFASGGDEEVIIWSEPGEGGEWARVQVLEDHTGAINAVCFSPDGKQLATGSGDKLIKTYNFNEGSAILAHTLEGHTHWIESLSFSPDCKTLCSGSYDMSIKFWNPADGSLVKSIVQAHTDYVSSVSCIYSPNGRILVSAGLDKTMKIWDAETFELKHTFEQVYSTFQLTITADSNFIVSANDDNTVRITSCREYHITALTPILNLILHIVYKWEFVTFPKQIYDIRAYLPTKNTPAHAHTIRLLAECVYNGGYDVTSVILSFLSPAHLPIQITPTRWKSKSRN